MGCAGIRRRSRCESGRLFGVKSELRDGQLVAGGFGIEDGGADVAAAADGDLADVPIAEVQPTE